MAYRSPYFIASHAGRAAGDAAITMSPSAASGFPKYRSIDGFGQSLAQHVSSGPSSYWQVDRGAGTLEAVDRLLIPSGHNLGAQTVTVKSSATGAYAGEETSLASFTSAAGLIEQAVTSSAARYLRVSFTGTGQWEYGEMWLGQKLTPARGPNMAWDIGNEPNLSVSDSRAGMTGIAELGPVRLVLSCTWSRLSDADLAVLTDLLSFCSHGLHSFYVAPPDDAYPITLVTRTRFEPFRQDHPSPISGGPRYGLRLDMREALG